MHRIIFIALLLLTTIATKAQEVTFFKGTLEQAKQKSLDEGKPLMVYIWAEWCGYCKFTEKEIFKHDTAYDFLNENYICFKLEDKSKAAQKIKRDYDLEILPAYIFYDSNGIYIRHSEGFSNGKELKAEAEKAIKKRKKRF